MKCLGNAARLTMAFADTDPAGSRFVKISFQTVMMSLALLLLAKLRP